MRAISLALDVLVVLVFALVGRLSHDLALSGLLLTAWPFLVGSVAGWALGASRGWPLRSVRTGAVTWLAALAIGMLIRVLIGEGTDEAFVLVAAGVLAVGMLGWRVVVAFVNGPSKAEAVESKESTR